MAQQVPFQELSPQVVRQALKHFPIDSECKSLRLHGASSRHLRLRPCVFAKILYQDAVLALLATAPDAGLRPLECLPLQHAALLRVFMDLDRHAVIDRSWRPSLRAWECSVSVVP